MYLRTVPLIAVVFLQCVAALPSSATHLNHTDPKPKQTNRTNDAEFESFMAYLKREEEKDHQIDRNNNYTGFFAPRHVIEDYLRTLDKKGTPATTPESQD
jgi:hypothetical protein